MDPDDAVSPWHLDAFKVPDGVKLILDMPYRNGHPAWRLDLAVPDPLSGSPRPAIIFLHGGGWRQGDKRIGYFLQGAIDYAKRGYVCASVNYRLAGEAPFPASVVDTRCAVRWLRAQAKTYNIDPSRIGAYGNSAGAHLAAMAGLAKNDPLLDGDAPLQEYSNGLQAVCGSAMPTDFSRPLNTRGTADFSRPGQFLFGPAETLELRKQKASPVQWVNADAPPMLLIHGDRDATVDLDQPKRLYQALVQAGAKDVTLLIVHGAGHGIFFDRPDITHPLMQAFFDRTLRAAEK